MKTDVNLRLENICVSYARRPVIDGLTLPPIPAGQVVALLGANGAGKTTLLNAIAGLIRATGTIRWNDLALHEMDPAARARSIAYMPQRLPDDWNVSVLESLLSILHVCPQTRHAGESELLALAQATLAQLDIAHLSMHTLRALSGGQRQMVSLAQAVAPGARLLLLDEPTSALDLRYQAIVMRTIRALANQQRIVVVVMHDLHLAARWADTVVVLHRGRAIAVGPPADALTPQVLGAAYGIEASVHRGPSGHLFIQTGDAIHNE